MYVIVYMDLCVNEKNGSQHFESVFHQIKRCEGFVSIETILIQLRMVSVYVLKVIGVIVICTFLFIMS